MSSRLISLTPHTSSLADLIKNEDWRGLVQWVQKSKNHSDEHPIPGPIISDLTTHLLLTAPSEHALKHEIQFYLNYAEFGILNTNTNTNTSYRQHHGANLDSDGL